MDLIKDLNGNTWSEAETRLYAQYTREIESTHQPDKIEFLKDQRHRFYVFTAEIYRIQKLEKGPPKL